MMAYIRRFISSPISNKVRVEVNLGADAGKDTLGADNAG